MVSSQPESPGFLKRISNCYQIEKGKYKQKGIGAWVGLIFLIFHFTLIPEILKLLWPYVEFSVPDKWLMGLTIICLNVFINVTYNIVMYFICTLKLPFFEQYRVLKGPWLWEKDYDAWLKLLKKVILITFVNYLIVSPSVIFLDLYFGSPCLLRTADAPTTFQMLWQFAIFLVVQDFGLYMAHSTIHHPKIYWVHKLHHQFNITIAVASNYSHPIQFILVSIPTLLGYKLVSPFYPVHIFTLIIWLTYRIAQTCDAHCGYEWPWAQAALFPMSGGSEYHNFHHSKNVGNFCGFFKFWDCVYNTNKEFVALKLKQKELQHQSQKKE